MKNRKVKRRTSSKKKPSGSMEKLFSKIKKAPKKQKVVASQRFSETEEQSSIGKVLIFLVVVHVLAIFAFVYHQRLTETNTVSGVEPVYKEALMSPTDGETIIPIKADEIFQDPNFSFNNNAGVTGGNSEAAQDRLDSKTEAVVKVQPKVKIAVYVVKNGETIEQVAFKFNMSVEDLSSMNDLSSTKLKTGQQLYIRQ